MTTLNSGQFNQTALKFSKALGIVALISLYDAIFGAGISAGLWPNITSQQVILDIWQCSLGVIVFFILYFGWAKRYDFDVAFTVLILLIGYLEDTLYYLFLPVTKYVVSFLSHGKLIVEPGFPEMIGGYLGWLTRFFGIVPSISIPLWMVVIMNIGGLAIGWILLQGSQRIK